MQTPAFRFHAICALAMLGLTSVSTAQAAGNLDEFRREFAHAVYAASPELVHDRNPQPLLRAVIVLNIKLGEDNRWQTDVMRTNKDQPELLARAIEAVEKVHMDEIPVHLRDELKRNGINETWLFEKDGTFQVMTLAKAQRSSL
jgi:hypothetical protein